MVSLQTAFHSIVYMMCFLPILPSDQECTAGGTMSRVDIPPVSACLNALCWCAVYVYVSYRLFLLTNTLKSAVIPAKVGPLLWRNFAIFGLASAFLYIAAVVMIHIIPFSPIISPILATRTV